jgi:hypothetical protein
MYYFQLVEQANIIVYNVQLVGKLICTCTCWEQLQKGKVFSILSTYPLILQCGIVFALGILLSIHLEGQ